MISDNPQSGYSLLDLGFNSALVKSFGTQQITPELGNVFSDGTAPRTLIAGELITVLEQQAGVVFSGKTAFSNATAGYRLGIEDELAKFYIGNSTSYFNWTGTALVIAGAISAGSIDIGGSDASSFHVDTDGNMWLGNAAFASAPFKVDNGGSLTVTGGTITGGTIQTATSGQRIVLTGASNNMTFYNSSASGVMDVGTSGTVIMRILPTNDDLSALIVQNNSALTLTSRLVELSVQKTASTAAAFYVANAGSGDTITTTPTGTGKGLVISNSGTGQSLYITQTSASNASHALEIDLDGTGRGIYLHDDKTSSTNFSLLVEKAGIGVVARFENTNSDVSTPVVLELTQTAVVSTNFKKILKLDTVTVWKSDGTTPNGNLSGTAGDICVNGSGSATFFCTGTTNWTGM